MAIQQLKKLINMFHKNHLDKPIAIFKAIDTAPALARPTIKLAAKPIIKKVTGPLKQKQGQLTNNTNK